MEWAGNACSGRVNLRFHAWLGLLRKKPYVVIPNPLYRVRNLSSITNPREILRSAQNDTLLVYWQGVKCVSRPLVGADRPSCCVHPAIQAAGDLRTPQRIFQCRNAP